MKKTHMILGALFAYSTAFAQDFKPFHQWEFGVTASTTGVGLEVATQPHEMVKVRAGFDFMPKFDMNMNFPISGMTPDGIMNSNKIASLTEIVESFTGVKMHDNVDMVGRPNIYNFKFLVNVYPFKNLNSRFLNNLYVTGGFYWGPSQIAEAVNATHDSQTLLGVQIFNSLYDRFTWEDEDGMTYYELYPIYKDYYLDPTMAYELYEKFKKYGHMGVYVGDKKDGTPYIMEPDEHGMVTAKMFVNSFKPYLGIGYEGHITRHFTISGDIGTLFWGGAPNVVLHDGTSLTNDLNNVRGKVGDYVKTIKGFKVYPVINLKLAFQIN